VIDKFKYTPSYKERMKIQERFQKTNIDRNVTDEQLMESIVFYYTAIAFDEGFRSATKENVETLKDYIYKDHLNMPKPLKRRSKKVLHYAVPEGVVILYDLIEKRLKSKKLRKNQYLYWQEQGIKFEEEMFLIMVCMNTGFEAGFSKASSMEHFIKSVSNEQISDIIINMIKDKSNEL
jgi:hypothetical protein